MADETSYERERRLIAEAERRARVDEHLKANDRQIQSNVSLIARLTADLSNLDGKLDALAAEFRQSVAIAEDRARTAEKAAAKQVTTRELYVAAAGVTAAIVGTLAAGGVLG